jgi:hypothetical protein
MRIGAVWATQLGPISQVRKALLIEINACNHLLAYHRAKEFEQTMKVPHYCLVMMSSLCLRADKDCPLSAEIVFVY